MLPACFNTETLTGGIAGLAGKRSQGRGLKRHDDIHNIRLARFRGANADAAEQAGRDQRPPQILDVGGIVDVARLEAREPSDVALVDQPVALEADFADPRLLAGDDGEAV